MSWFDPISYVFAYKKVLCLIGIIEVFDQHQNLIVIECGVVFEINILIARTCS